MRTIAILLLLLLAIPLPAEQQGAILGAAHRRNASGGTVSLTYVTTHTTNSTQSAYLFPDVSLGAEAVNRNNWIIIGSRDTGTGLVLNSVTISNSTSGLVNGTRGVSTNQTSGGNLTMAEAWYVPIAGGTTGDIRLTFSETTLRARIAVYRVTGQNTMDYDAEITVGTLSSMSVTGTSGSATIAMAFTATGSTSFTWAGVTEDYDGAVGTSTSSGGSNPTASVGVNNITGTALAAGATASVAVAIRP